MIPLAKPDITEKERESVLDILKTTRLSLGPKLGEFEKKIAEYVGVKYAVAVNSGTSALHLIIKSLGISDGDEVITTPFSFISSSNCILFENAKPVFVDIDPRSFNIDVNKIEEKITSRTKAILAVDVFGRAADWEMLECIAKKHNLKLIEDSADSLGTKYGGKKCGSFGDAGIFAFYPNKQITTGAGGMVTTDNEDIYRLCKSMRNQGRGDDGDWLQHKRLGHNYRISEINCALGIAQLERIDELIQKRNNVFRLYSNCLADINGLTLPDYEINQEISWWVYVVLLGDQFSRGQRDKIIKELALRGIQCSNYFTPIHLQPFYKKRFGYSNGSYPICEHISERTLALPFFNQLDEKQVRFIAENLKIVMGEVSR